MDILERINEQMAATGLPLVGITLAAVPCPDTPPTRRFQALRCR
jgi:hypothetical protein